MVLRGAEKLYKPVSETLGPRGKNVVFRKKGKRVGITHDGVTVAKMVKSNDDAEDAIIDIMREAALALDSATGDGTTTVTVLTYAVMRALAKLVYMGMSPMAIKRELETLSPKIVEQVRSYVDTEVTEEKLIQVASVSAGDAEVGTLVGKLMFEAGADTPILLNFSQNQDTYSEVISGFKIDSGPASPYLMGDSIYYEVPNPKIAVIDAKLRDRDDIMPLLETMATYETGERRFLIVCSDVAGDALAYLVANRLKGFADIAVARVPEHIMSHSEYLSDVATACGAKLISRNSSQSLSAPQKEYFGSADKVTVEPRETVIVNAHPVVEDLEAKLDQLRKLKETGKTEAARRFAQDRLMALEQKIVAVFVGGKSESDAEERHYRFEDAVGASKAALRGGVVVGGGTLLYAISQGDTATEVEKAVYDALSIPLKKIYANAGITEEHKISYGFGCDVMHPEEGVIDLRERGILDPAESEIESVKTALTVAGLLLTAGAMIIEEEDDDEVSTEVSTYQG